MFNWFGYGGAQAGGDRERPANAFGGQDVAVEAMHGIRKRMRDHERAVADHSSWVDHAQAPLTAVKADRIQFGPCDNPGVFEAIGQEAGIVRSIFRHLDGLGFPRARAEACEFTVEDLVVITFITSLRMKDRPTRRLQTALEAIIPNLPEAMCLSQAEAREELARLLNNTENLATIEWFQDGRRNLREDTVLRHWEETAWAAAATLDNKMELIRAMARVCNPEARTRALGTIVTTMLSFAMRGTVSAPKLARICNDLRGTMPGIAGVITQQDIAVTWELFGHYVDDRVMPGIMRRWLNQIPAAAIRLRVILSQSAGSGMTMLDMIAEAIHNHPEFPWVIIRRMYPEEWVAAGRGIKLVGTNPYFGYRGDLEAVRSTRFKRLATVAGRLLIACGNRSLENYRGFADDPINKPVIDKLIGAYTRTMAVEDHTNAVFTNEEIQNHAAMVEIVGFHPVNNGGLANMQGHPDPV